MRFGHDFSAISSEVWNLWRKTTPSLIGRRVCKFKTSASRPERKPNDIKLRSHWNHSWLKLKMYLLIFKPVYCTWVALLVNVTWRANLSFPFNSCWIPANYSACITVDCLQSLSLRPRFSLEITFFGSKGARWTRIGQEWREGCKRACLGFKMTRLTPTEKADCKHSE